MRVSKLDYFKEYEVKNMIIIKGGEDGFEDIYPGPSPYAEEQSPWWMFWK